VGERHHLTPEQREATLRRFEVHRRAWERNALLRLLYGDWYRRIAALLPAESLGPRVEIGSGPGFGARFIPGLVMTDVVSAPWHAAEVAAENLPYADASVGALVLFDVLHHIPAPLSFFGEAARVLAPGGRIVLCEPFVSPLSWPVYNFIHEEPVDMRADPFGALPLSGDDPFDSNQALPTLLFGRLRDEFARRFPTLRIVSSEPAAGYSYPASGGFSHGPLLPAPLWGALKAIDDRLPAWLLRIVGFRLFTVLEKQSPYP